MIDKIYLSKSLSQQKSRMVLVSRAVSAVTLILGILLIGQMYGVAGIAISFVLSLVFQTVVMGIANMRKIG